MKKLIKNRIFLGSICVVFALLISFGALPLVQQLTSRNTTVLRAKMPIAKGERIAPEQVELVEVGRYNLPVSILTATTDAIGKYAAHNMATGDYVTGEKLSVQIPYSNAYLYTLDEGKLAISIEVKSLSAGLSGKLREGDVVSVFASLPDRGNEASLAAQAPSELQYVKVLSVTNQNTKDVDDNTVANAVENAEKMISTVTLQVNKVQAQLLAGLDNQADIHLALVSRGDGEKMEALLQLQETYFNKLPVQQTPTSGLQGNDKKEGE